MEKGDPEKFSVVLGGPLYQLFLRWRLVDPPIGFVTRRIAAAIAVTWLPILALTIAAGTAFGGARVPFFLDPEVHVRLLIALPLLLAAEPIVHQRLSSAVRQFVERGIVRAEDRERFAAIVEDTVRLRNSIAIELLLVAAAFSLGTWIWHQELAPRGVDSWSLAAGPAAGEALSTAGAWYAFASLGLFRFVLMRWYFRLALWYLFVWRVSRLPLHVNPLHPDGAGGLGFLATTLHAMVPILLAQSAAVAGVIAGLILHQGAALASFYLEIGVVVALLVAIGLAPLAFFMPALAQAGIQGRQQYGLLAMRYVDGFHDKWLRRPPAADPSLLGSADIQSLADLANAHQVLQQMRVLPIGTQAITRFAIAVALPFAPLLLSLIPLNELIPRLVTKLI